MYEACKIQIQKFLARNPLVPVAFGLIFGVLLAGNNFINCSYPTIIAFAALSLLFLAFFVVSGNFGVRHLFVFLAFSCFGLALEEVNGTDIPEQEFPTLESYQLIVDDALGISQGKYKCSALGLYSLPSIALQIPEEVLLNPGDTVTVQTRPQLIFSREIPGVFDYRNFLIRKGIGFQVKVDQPDQLVIAYAEATRLTKWRNYLSVQIGELYENQHHSSIVHAFILGDRSGLNEEVTEIYRRSGAMHVLAVSGLHVGMISLILNVLLLGIRRFENLKIFRSLIVLAGIWSFALLTGLGASVVRAAIMFTALQAHLILGKGSKSSLNIMCSAAVAIIILRPNQIYDIGFQFSFLAVLGILLFGQRIFAIFSPSNRLLSYAWGIIAISMAAQTFITPFALFYFSEISTVSCFSSLFAIPGAALILFGSIVSLSVNAVSSELAQLVSVLVESTISTLDFVLKFISDLKFSVCSIDRFGHWELLATILVLFIFFLGLARKSQISLAFSLVILLSLCSWQQWRSYRLKSELAIIEYNQGTSWEKIYCVGSHLILKEAEEPSKWVIDFAKTKGISSRIELPAKSTIPALKRGQTESQIIILDNPFIKFYKLSNHGD